MARAPVPPHGLDRAGLLRALGTELGGVSSAAAVADRALARLAIALDLEWTALSLPQTGRPALFTWGDCPQGTMTELQEIAIQTLPLVAAGVTIGTLLLGPTQRQTSREADQEFLGAALPVVALALQGATLLSELEAQATILGQRERELADLSRQLMRAQEEERARIALELHDDPLQRSILLSRRMGSSSVPPDVASWRRAVTEIADALQAICAGLHPRVLDDFGLVAGLEWLAESLAAQGETAIQLAAETADGSAFGRLASDLELALFRIAQEALSNSLKHARATRIVVILWQDGELVRLSVSDNGVGPEAHRQGERAQLHLGLVGMTERLRPWVGRVQMSPGPQGGTVVIAEVELPNADAGE